MKRLLFTFIVSLCVVAPLPAQEAPGPALIVGVGAGGTDQFAAQFGLWALQWRTLGEKGGIKAQLVGGVGNEGKDKERLAKAIAAQPVKSSEPLWIVLIGHGTWDGRTANFNLRGDDLSVTEFANWLKPFERPLVIAATFSTSGAWLKELSGPNRIVITATRSGSEDNFSRFGEYLPTALSDPEADLDKDGQVSALEGWLTASAKTQEFYKNEGRLATEHALLEDNGDGKGTPPDWFKGVRAVKKSQDNAVPDGIRAHQIALVPNSADGSMPGPVRQQRDALELEIAKLRDAKSTLKEDEYYGKLEQLLLQLAAVYAD